MTNTIALNIRYELGELMSKMVKSSKSLCSIAFLVMLLFGTYLYSIPPANAAESDLQANTLSILSTVVGLDTEQYTISKSLQRNDNSFDQQQKETDITLVSQQGSLRVTCSYIKGTLQQLFFSDSVGQPILKKQALTTLEESKSFLHAYQNYAADSIYGKCASMLSAVDATNISKSENGIKFELSTSDKITNYKWTYIDANGVIAQRKNIILNYEDGQLKFFLNNWPLYTVEGTPKITSQEATAIAIEASKNFSYQVTSKDGSIQTVSGFNIDSTSLGKAVLVYQNFNTNSSSRGGDPYVLYPTWFVPLGFDKFYPGNVSSMVVYLWADTGEVNYMQEVVIDSSLLLSGNTSTLNDQQTNVSEDSISVSTTIALMFCFGAIVVSLCCRKRISSASNGLSYNLGIKGKRIFFFRGIGAVYYV